MSLLAWLAGSSFHHVDSLSGQAASRAGAEIVFLDVGQGDAVLIRSDTFNILIDAGNSGHIMRDLNDLGVHHIQLLIASHSHDDHIGDMDDVVRNRQVDLFMDNTCPEPTLTYRNLHSALNRHHVPQVRDSAQTLTFGSVSLEILPSPFNECPWEGENNVSIGVLVRVGAFTALLTGDSQVEELNAWMKEGIIPDVDVLKAAHHGSWNGVTPGWIHTTKPEVVVISVGADNSYHHPDTTALRRYGVHGTRVLRTDRDGSVRVCIQPGGKYQVRTQVEGECE